MYRHVYQRILKGSWEDFEAWEIGESSAKVDGLG